MGILKEWKDSFEAFEEGSQEQYDYWQDYLKEETKIYKDILANSQKKVEGTIETLAEKYEIEPAWYAAFLDGINDSLVTAIDNLEDLELSDTVEFEIDFEKLYRNMLAVPADWLYGLPEWDNIFPEEKRAEITKDYKRSKTIVKGKKTGRNDPCPCGSGKKYKKCCGA